MIEFSPLYTGKDSAVKMPELTQLNRAQERAQELNIKGEELKYNAALQDKGTFMKQLSVDPVATVSNANMVKQAQKYDEFKNKWADRLAKSGGRLSDADKIQMEVDHNNLKGWQNQILANQARYLAALETKKRDTKQYYDPNAFEIAQNKYLETGELDPNMLTVAPQSMTAYLGGLKPTQETVTPIKTEVKDDKGNIVGYRIVDRKTKATKEQAQYNILEGAKRNEGLMKGIITDFDRWFNDPKTPQKDKDNLLKDYDTNGNEKIDPEESQYIHTNTSMPDNPIMKWAMNYPPYLERGMGIEEGASKAISTTKGGNSSTFSSIDIGMGTPVRYQPTERQSFKKYKTYHAVPEWPTQNIPANNITVQKPDGEKIKVADKTLSLQLTGYDEDTDEFTFITKGNYWSGNTMGAGDQIAISRAEVPPKFNDFEILVNGQKVKVNDVKRTAQATEIKLNKPSKPSFPEWKKLNPNGTVADYNKL